MTPRHVTNVVVPALGTVAFQAGGYHRMCASPSSAISPGKKVPFTLAFQKIAPLTMNFAVCGATDDSPVSPNIAAARPRQMLLHCPLDLGPPPGRPVLLDEPAQIILSPDHVRLLCRHRIHQ